MTIKEILYLVEADNIYLAEETLYSASVAHYQELLRGFTSVHLEKPRRSPWSRLKALFTKEMPCATSVNVPKISTHQLRHILIADNVTLGQILGRVEYLDGQQNAYLTTYRNFSPLDRKYENYRDIQETLKYVVHDQEVKDKERSDYSIELILLCFTSLSFMSVVTDIADFINMRSSYILSFTRILITISLSLVLVVFVIVTSRLRKRISMQ